MKKINIAAIGILLVLIVGSLPNLTGLSDDSEALLHWKGKNSYYQNQIGTAWMSMEPVQCNENAWQESQYSTGHKYNEKDSIKEYLEDNGVTVLHIKIQKKDKIVCMSCDCPRGDEVQVLIYRNDIEKMIKLGFQEVEVEGCDCN
ncbi:Uncharacterised protein [uncultured archaeon]|nr:Uncharacterised protein [uncultured archaeon]